MGSYRPRHQAPAATGAVEGGVPAFLAVLLSLALVVSAFLTRPASAAQPEDPDADVSISLSYTDGQDHPTGVTVRPGSDESTDFSGYINVNTDTNNRPTKTITNLTVTLRVPKSHISGIIVPDFTDSWTGTKSSHTISQMTQNGDDDIVTITWPTYDPSTTSNIKFSITTDNQTTPDGFVFEPEATISSDQNPTTVTSNKLIVTVKYPSLTLTKSANGQNKEGATVVGTTAKYGAQYIPEDGATLVSYTFAASGTDRALTSVTVTDTLPTYTDYKGLPQTAVFISGVNPGWTQNGTTVSYTVTSTSTDSAATLVSKIPALKLSFPGLPLPKTGSFTQNGTTTSYNYAEVTNTAKVTTVVSNPGTGEKAPTADGSITADISTSEAAGQESSTAFLAVFASSAGGDNLTSNISDTVKNKNNTLEWHLQATNNRSYDMKNVELDDTSTPSGLSGYGPDSRLKVTGISSMTISGLTNAEVLSAVSAIRAYKAGGASTDYTDYKLSESTSGKLSVTFDTDTTYSGFSVIFKSNWLWKQSVRINIYADTKLRDPDNVHWTSPQETPSNSITNKVRMSGQLVTETIKKDSSSSTESVLGDAYSTASASYVLQQFAESLSFGDDMGFMHMPDGGSSTAVGSTLKFIVPIKGTLDPGKTYSNLRVVLLLPRGTTWQKYDSTGSGYNAPDALCKQLVDSDSITTDSDWNGTGRTLVTIPLKQDIAKQLMTGGNDWQINLQFLTELTDASSPETNGSVLVAFITADNAPNPGTQKGFSSYTSELPEVGGKGVYPNYRYNFGPHETVAAEAKAYTVNTGAQLYGSQTVQEGTTTSKYGLDLSKGTSFTYHLTVHNFGDLKRPGLVLYDALPSTSQSGGSLFNIRLTEYPTAPSDDYELLYTTEDVTSLTANEAVNKSIWHTAEELGVDGYSGVTAIKMVPKNPSSTQTAANTSFTLDLKVTVPKQTVKQPDASAYSTNPVNGIGLIAMLDAVNRYSFGTEAGSNASGIKSANSTYARLGSVAGFVIKKVDATDTSKKLPGAAFSFTTTSGTSTSAITSDPSSATTGSDGLVTFYGLNPSGGTLTGTLTETTAPANYLKADGLSISVSTSSDTLSMTCTVAKKDGDTSSASTTSCTGSGTKESPFVIGDQPIITTMPATGGRLGMLVLAVAATALLALLATAGCMLLRPRKRKH